MTTLVIATRNAHKVAEIRAILNDPFRFVTLNDFPDAPSIAEDAETFAGNAAKKAAGLACWLAAHPSTVRQVAIGRWFSVADDSGLEVDALEGAPGVYSARFAALDEGPPAGHPLAAANNSPDAANNAKLLRLLEGLPIDRRTARFCCVLALVETAPHLPPGPPRLFEGTCEGHIGSAPQGQNGFGYDPLFVPSGQQQSFAELGESVKNRLSHRAKALAKLSEWLRREVKNAPGN